MKKSLLNKFIASTLLLLILTLSATATAASEGKNTITASAVGNGEISPSGEVRVQPGKPPTFYFIPKDANNFHVSSIVVDGVYESGYAESYTFANIKGGEHHTITVYFSANTETEVPEGNGVTVFINSEVILTLDATKSGVAMGTKQIFRGGTSVAVWEITNTAIFDGEVLVGLQYDDSKLTLDQEKSLRLIRGDSLYAVYSDVNNDLVVDGTDVSIVANAVKQHDWYNPFLDVNNDDVVDENDVHIVNGNIGTTLVDITDHVNPDLNIIYGITDHFSLFRAH
jgi:hypothetical protein